MKNKYLLITVGIFFLSCFIVLFKGLENPNIYKPNFKQGKSLPEFESLEFYSNKKILTSEIFINKSFYLVNIWASWCIPCRTEHSYLNKLKKEKSIKLVGINYKDNFENAKKFLNQFGNPYAEILQDKDGTISITLGAYGVPETLIVNKRKQIIKKIIGPIDKKKYNEILKIIK